MLQYKEMVFWKVKTQIYTFEGYFHVQSPTETWYSQTLVPVYIEKISDSLFYFSCNAINDCSNWLH